MTSCPTCGSTTRRLYSRADAGIYLDKSLSEIDRLISSGRLLAKKDGRRTVIDVAGLDRVCGSPAVAGTEVGTVTDALPHLFSVKDAATALRMRSKLRDRTFAGVKLAGRWYMTEAQIQAVIDAASTVARPQDAQSPTGLSARSRFARRARMGNGR